MNKVTPILAATLNAKRDNDRNELLRQHRVRADLLRQQKESGNNTFKDILAMAMVG